MPHLRSPFTGVALVSTLFVLTACGHSESDPRTEPPTVRIATASAVEGTGGSYSGIISSRVQSDLGFRIGGKVTARLVDAGQKVRRGQVLMRIDATDYLLNSSTLSSRVAAAQALAGQTAADEKRYHDLLGSGAISLSAYDKIKADAQSARAQLAAIRAEAAVARHQADYAVLVADADGTVVETLAEPGQVVAAGQPVVRLARAGAREATVSLPETERPAIGSLARATLFNGSGASTARLRLLSDAADPLTRTYEARYVLEGPAASAPLGSTVTIVLNGNVQTVPSLQVPLGALHDLGKGPGVWVVGSQNAVRWRPVKLVALGEESATIATGLRPGETFVALGAHMLHEGEKVRPVAKASKVASR